MTADLAVEEEMKAIHIVLWCTHRSHLREKSEEKVTKRRQFEKALP